MEAQQHVPLHLDPLGEKQQIMNKDKMSQANMICPLDEI